MNAYTLYRDGRRCRVIQRCDRSGYRVTGTASFVTLTLPISQSIMSMYAIPWSALRRETLPASISTRYHADDGDAG